MSLLMRMMQDPFFDDKQILVVDKAPKQQNDRTWCFWEKEKGLFESIVYHQWKQLDFFSNDYSATLAIDPYRYKMIRGIDFYQYVLQKAANKSNVHFHYEEVLGVGNENNKAVLTLPSGKITADYIFNSILFREPKITARQYMLLQHFKGWVIETPTPVFDPSKATFMDFRVSQKEGTTFMYVLPVSTNKALVEYTLFTETLLPQEKYSEELIQYLSDYLGINTFTIEQEEFGIIPMTNHVFPSVEGKVIYIGIAGGQAKGSSGYAFQFIQKRTASVVDALKNNRVPKADNSINAKKFRLYDSVLLSVLHHKKLNGDQIFAAIFQKNPPQRVLRFLDNETSVWDDLHIMNSVPTGIFLKAAMQQLFR
jgi:lycopene beta-cyclase